MPELPEVETIKNDLLKKIIDAEVKSVETDWPKLFKGPDFEGHKKEIVGKKIIGVERRAKNLLIKLSDNKTLLIHLKMTGHLLVTDENIEIKYNRFIVDPKSPLSDPNNQFIHVVWHLLGGKKLAFSDLRKFGNILILDDHKLKEYLEDYGPEPLEDDFNYKKFACLLEKKKTGIKKFLMDQTNIAGIGNIYADEILFDSKIHPERDATDLKEEEKKALFASIKKILKKAVELRGTSVSDYRDTEGKKGAYGDIRLVYRKTGEPCPDNCGGRVKRIVVGGRGTHFCPVCQIKQPERSK
ncbi:DNA-formamidopyrimidine glycosylase [bacterium CG2_30_37_16]|nr:MAG: DNA-formamidopyrimidine glycosylase [bacterium CG2_30_37_16]PIP30513.1 MAG: formamidopyrimidine-DNA glycosylase [bacterium (Candidatus Howlettbacteria) CG23_combo_of_CG06-09_8_20_14_all_37_9]PJB07408.1 MAG: formamidopyrimidine-DNA glycosylase [bacterium (Candidatus Howlettbacteria) CG_4_9_14_3_um_filter_37_10]